MPPKRLIDLIERVYEFYGQSLSPFILALWENALADYEGAAIAQALQAYITSSQGKFCPKPADIIELLSGNTSEHALLAWSKVLKAMKHIGAGPSVVFDDAFIHLVVVDLGGWMELCTSKEAELVFIERRFTERYRLYAKMLSPPQHLPCLIGVVEASNYHSGYGNSEFNSVVTIGEDAHCQRVWETGKAITDRNNKRLTLKAKLNFALALVPYAIKQQDNHE